MRKTGISFQRSQQVSKDHLRFYAMDVKIEKIIDIKTAKLN